MNEEFKKTFEQLMEKNLPVAFLDYEILTQIKKLVVNKDSFGRKEILIVAYLIGANSIESNTLLSLTGHRPLYAKKREDAIWIYALDNHWKSADVIAEMFPRIADEKNS